MNYFLKDGDERFTREGKEENFDLLQFWRWAMSNLLDNVNRGTLAEFIVAKALGIELTKQRSSWDSYDLETADGIKIEVKSSAFLQSWDQKKHSTPSFKIPKTRSYCYETNQYTNEPKRQADIYVFALFSHTDKETADPMNFDQWSFYATSTKRIEHLAGKSRSISLATLKRMGLKPRSFSELSEEVKIISAS